MRVYVLRTRQPGEGWVNRAVFSAADGLRVAAQFGHVLQATVGGGCLEVATDTFEVDVMALPVVNELGRDGNWKVENRNGELVDRTPAGA